LLGTHDGPVLHCIAPFVHGLFVGHEAPTVHALHTPLEQTPVPDEVVHGVPSIMLPFDMHSAWPVVHDVWPFVHGLPVGQDAPCEHALHMPW
jgi:hypothetical protein